MSHLRSANLSAVSDPAPNPANFSCPAPPAGPAEIQLAHGGGGRLTEQLLERIFGPAFGNPALDARHDGAVLAAPVGARLAFTTDSHVVSPLFFPGGDIGRLAVYGTANDLAMCGARPRWLSAGFILEEGLPVATLERVVAAMAEAARGAGVQIVTGDTKVVERGKADGLYINTSGLGSIPDGANVSVHNAVPGDAVLISGEIGLHGVAVLAARGGLGFASSARSDVAPLNGLLAPLVAEIDVHAMRDPTRGGCSAALHEIAGASGVSIVLDEASLPVPPVVAGACELLGTDPLEMPNEGKALVVVPEGRAARAAELLRVHPYGRAAVQIGRVTRRGPFPVTLATALGERLVEAPRGELLPRIC